MRFSYRRQAEDSATVEVDIVALEGSADGYRITIGEQVFELSARLFQRAAFVKETDTLVLQYEGQEYRLFDATKQRRAAPRVAGDLGAPMAGKVIQVLVVSGAQVKRGDPLVILEAMKMEQQIVAPHDGVVDR
ncbi:MAG: biotin/lipoyl-binding protein, partial [bacterium]|nr:biotin/lipoyl-binding protein [bacterium]